MKKCKINKPKNKIKGDPLLFIEKKKLKIMGGC
jgi:hypothetical protein